MHTVFIVLVSIFHNGQRPSMAFLFVPGTWQHVDPMEIVAVQLTSAQIKWCLFNWVFNEQARLLLEVLYNVVERVCVQSM